MLWLTVNEPAGGSFMVPVKSLISLQDVTEFLHHGQVFKFSAAPAAKIVVECDFGSDELRRMLDWGEQVAGGLVFGYKRTGSILFLFEEGVPLAERPVYGLWPSVMSPDSSTLRVTITLVYDLMGADLSDNHINFVEGIFEEEKVEIEQALTPKGLATLKRYGVQLVED